MKDSQIVIVPNNEGRVCDAVVRALEKWTRETRTDLRHPDKEGGSPPVDLRLRLGAQDYAIEHTRIESFGNQIGTVTVANRIVRHVRKNIPDLSPGPAYYELQFRIDVSLPGGRNRRTRALNSLVQWVRTSERVLRDRNPVPVPPVRNPHLASDWIRGTPDGFDCEFQLLHWPVARLIPQEPGALAFRFIPQDDPDGPRLDSLRQTFSRKYPKLQACKEEGARTVLVLESGDPALVHFEFRGGLLPSLLAGSENPPDEIFLVETHADHRWRTWLLKRDDGHWPDTGMPELGPCYYDPEPSGLPGIPEWLENIPQWEREALQLDLMYTPFVRGWAPATYEKNELDDMAAELNAACP